jgi:DDE superfamily endonuclease
MNPAKCDETDYINFLVASPRVYSCREAERVQPEQASAPAHDAFTRLLHRLEPDAETLWTEAQPQVQLTSGVLVVDDTTLDKPYARAIELVSRHWSGKHRQVVQGINLVTLLWSDGDRPIPCDYCIYHKDSDGATKNDHFRAMLKTARARGFQPTGVLFDSWYSGLENLKLIRAYQWLWLTRLKSNRLVSLNFQGNRPVSEQPIAESSTLVHLKGYGMVKVFKVVTPDGDSEYWATNDLQMTGLTRLKFSDYAWQIEHYHRGLKQFCGVERCQVRAARAQRNHIVCALRAFLRLEQYCFVKGISWFEAKTAIIRDAVRAYLAQPTYTLNATA